jgi:hypothetical protein
LRKAEPKRPDKRAQRTAAEEGVAEFLARGGAIKRGPDVVPTLLTCRNCGSPSVVGITNSHRRGARCPRCGGIAI